MASGIEKAGFTDRFRVDDGVKVKLAKIDPGATPGVKNKGTARRLLEDCHAALNELQEVLYAQSRHAVLFVVQAMDTGGKDGAIRHVFGPLNPQGVRVTGFKKPTAVEAAHDFLWRIHAECPARGMIRVFNRSHYEDVLVPRVHKLVRRGDIRRRLAHINRFERLLTDAGTTIVKFYLHISRDEQKRRLQRRLDRPDKHWKFNRADLDERQLWDDYMEAYEDLLARCSPRRAPWYVVPADHKWYRDIVIGRVALDTLRSLDLDYPPAEPGLEGISVE